MSSVDQFMFDDLIFVDVCYISVKIRFYMVGKFGTLACLLMLQVISI